MADPAKLETIKWGVGAWDHWQTHYSVRPDLSGVDSPQRGFVPTMIRRR
jgi:hypothetical protein